MITFFENYSSFDEKLDRLLIFQHSASMIDQILNFIITKCSAYANGEKYSFGSTLLLTTNGPFPFTTIDS